MTAGVKPFEAAGLVLIRRSARDEPESAEVLLGRRHAAARFMPGVYVVPGGRTCPADRKRSGFDETLAPSPPGLDPATRRRLPILSRAALRETYEETGLLVGRPGVAPGSAERDPIGSAEPPRAEPWAEPWAERRAEPWAAYAKAGLVPAFDGLRPIGRAITPPGSPIRFDTHFFQVEGTQARGTLGGDGELEDLGWVPVAATAALPMPAVTRRVLNEALLGHLEPDRRVGLDSATAAAIFGAEPNPEGASEFVPWPNRLRSSSRW